jgi:hypothetical protein
MTMKKLVYLIQNTFDTKYLNKKINISDTKYFKKKTT